MGDNEAKAPGFFSMDFVGKAKWNAWGDGSAGAMH